MKWAFLSSCFILFCTGVSGQISITATDMPVAGDTLRYSMANPAGTTISPADSGGGISWNYPLAYMGQAVDSYLTALQVNPLYVLEVGATAYGYKVADSFPIPGGLLPVSIQQIYTFFEIRSSPSRFEAKAFAASLSGLPTAINYTQPDVWYYFPMNYGNQDSAAFALNITLPTLGSIKEAGIRSTRVDGWGNISTPYYTTPVNCLRIRSVVHQIDSIPFGPVTLGIPVNTVDYKWLVNGDHYPALWVTSTVSPVGNTETITQIRYRDINRDTGTVNAVPRCTAAAPVISAWPTPAQNGLVRFGLPSGWTDFEITIWDMQSRLVAVFRNELLADISNLAPGAYLARVSCGGQYGYTRIIR